MQNTNLQLPQQELQQIDPDYQNTQSGGFNSTQINNTIKIGSGFNSNPGNFSTPNFTPLYIYHQQFYPLNPAPSFFYHHIAGSQVEQSEHHQLQKQQQHQNQHQQYQLPIQSIFNQTNHKSLPHQQQQQFCRSEFTNVPQSSLKQQPTSQKQANLHDASINQIHQVLSEVIDVSVTARSPSKIATVIHPKQHEDELEILQDDAAPSTQLHEQLIHKELEIQKLRDELDQTRRWSVSVAHEYRRLLHTCGGGEKPEDLIDNLSEGNLNIRDIETGGGVGSNVLGGNSDDTANRTRIDGSGDDLTRVDAVAAAAEESIPAGLIFQSVDSEKEYEKSSRSGCCEMMPFSALSLTFAKPGLTDSLPSSILSSVSVSIPWTLNPIPTTSVVKSIWSPLNESARASNSSTIPEFLEPKEFAPSRVLETHFNSSMDELSGSDSSLMHLRSIWEVDDSFNYGDSSGLYYDSLDDGELLLKNNLRHKGYRGSCMSSGQQATFHHLVEKIVRTQDQPASLLLQQKLVKAANPVIRSQIIEAILYQALNLTRNRFGNFLVQRCLEVGDREQIRALTTCMLGGIVILSCDRFGCHVVQKALDVCDDDLKVSIINELLVAISDTVTHRFACHVWQRVFETKWQLHPYSAVNLSILPSTPAPGSPDDFHSEFALTSSMHPAVAVVRRLDLCLKNQWHVIANDESGSLVVQCIFDNCPESEKRGIVSEVLLHAGEIAKGQWGNWVIQHLLDRGYSPDKCHIFQVVSHNIHELSVDQFASKVVEKALKTCQKRELYTIIDRVINTSLGINGHPVLIEMMNNQYANYVVQHILTLAEPQQRDICVKLIAPHLTLLRGSKYGQRVAAIVEKYLRSGSRSVIGIQQNLKNTTSGRYGLGERTDRLYEMHLKKSIENKTTNKKSSKPHTEGQMVSTHLTEIVHHYLQSIASANIRNSPSVAPNKSWATFDTSTSLAPIATDGDNDNDNNNYSYIEYNEDENNDHSEEDDDNSGGGGGGAGKAPMKGRGKGISGSGAGGNDEDDNTNNEDDDAEDYSGDMSDRDEEEDDDDDDDAEDDDNSGRPAIIHGQGKGKGKGKANKRRIFAGKGKGKGKVPDKSTSNDSDTLENDEVENEEDEQGVNESEAEGEDDYEDDGEEYAEFVEKSRSRVNNFVRQENENEEEEEEEEEDEDEEDKEEEEGDEEEEREEDEEYDEENREKEGEKLTHQFGRKRPRYQPDEYSGNFQNAEDEELDEVDPNEINYSTEKDEFETEGLILREEQINLFDEDLNSSEKELSNYFPQETDGQNMLDDFAAFAAAGSYASETIELNERKYGDDNDDGGNGEIGEEGDFAETEFGVVDFDAEFNIDTKEQPPKKKQR
ncbi:hypothetical protein HK100_005802, partial [Physocladia obscura]